MDIDIIIYVSAIQCKFDSGIGEYMEEENLYVGINYDKAKEVLNNYDISESLYHYGYIEHWKNGEKIDTESIIV